ncbi:pyridoxal phosphate-dependent aminotransferase [Methanocella sp. MCL-LM]|uniref:pyridoxal phosphate-dependent aminotransferase n=1 Tax=Methanocella sp. MCL-LM TaxID=3412035 RepID=UPI003C72F172
MVKLSEKAMGLPPFIVMDVLERAQALERSGRNIVHLEVGEPDFPTPSHICEAAEKALKRGETKYTHSLGLLALREAVAEYYNGKFGLDLRADQVIITSGTSPALLLLFTGLLEPGNEVVMSNPYYACYPNFVKCAGGKPRFAYVTGEDGFTMKPESVAAQMSRDTRAILINSPCNPTGRVMRPGDYRGICEAAGDIPVISDEIYQGLVYEGEDHTVLEYTDNAFVLNGFSKLFAMTGWRLGYLIAPRDCIRPLQKIQQNLFICANSFVQHAGVAALRGPQDHIREMVSEYDRRRLYMLKRLKAMGLGVECEPEGAYYVLADARRFSPNSLELSRSILEEAGVAVTPGIDFGDGAEGYLRFSYSNSLDNIKEGMDRLELYLKRLKAT